MRSSRCTESLSVPLTTNATASTTARIHSRVCISQPPSALVTSIPRRREQCHGISTSVTSTHQALVPGLLEVGDVRVRLEELGEGLEAERLLAEGRVHAAHMGLHRGAVQPFRIAAVTELEGALQQAGRRLAGVRAVLVAVLLGLVLGLLLVRAAAAAGAGGSALLVLADRAAGAGAGGCGAVGQLDAGEVLVGLELVARGGEGLRGRAGHAHPADLAAQAAAA